LSLLYRSIPDGYFGSVGDSSGKSTGGYRSIQEGHLIYKRDEGRGMVVPDI